MRRLEGSIASAALLLLIAAFAAACNGPRVPEPGWSCKLPLAPQCTPDKGNWDGLKIGMSYPDALQAACRMIGENMILPDGYAIGVVEPIAFAYDSKCPVKDGYAVGERYSHHWEMTPAHMICEPFGPKDAPTVYWRVQVEFDSKYRVSSIRGDCPPEAF